MADTTYKAEYNTLASIFNAGWVTVPADGEEAAPFSPVQYENLAYTPVPGTKWARFTVSGGESQQASIGAPGNNCYRYTGSIQIQCFAPLNMGVAEAKEMADKAISIFMFKQQSGYHFRAGYAVTVQNSIAEGWYQVNAVIPFWRDACPTEPVAPEVPEEPTEE